MASTIKVKRSSTASAVPASLAEGELAANTTDGKLFLGKADTSVVEIGAGGGGGATLTVEALESVKAGDPIELVKSGTAYKARKFRPGWRSGAEIASSDPAVYASMVPAYDLPSQDYYSETAGPKISYFSCGDYAILGYIALRGKSKYYVIYSLRLSDFDGSVIEVADNYAFPMDSSEANSARSSTLAGACASSTSGYGYVYTNVAGTSTTAYVNFYGFKLDSKGKISVGSPSTSTLRTYSLYSSQMGGFDQFFSSISDDANNAALLLYPNVSKAIDVYTLTMNESTLAVTIQDESTISIVTGTAAWFTDGAKVPGLNCLFIIAPSSFFTIKWDSNTDYTPALQDEDNTYTTSTNYQDSKVVAWSSTKMAVRLTAGMLDVQLDSSGNITAGNITAGTGTASTVYLTKTDTNTLLELDGNGANETLRKWSYDSGTSAFVIDQEETNSDHLQANVTGLGKASFCIPNTNIASMALVGNSSEVYYYYSKKLVRAATANDTDGILKSSVSGRLFHDISGNGFGLIATYNSITAFNTITQEVGTTLTLSHTTYGTDFDIVFSGTKVGVFYFDSGNSNYATVKTISFNQSTLALTEVDTSYTSDIAGASTNRGVAACPDFSHGKNVMSLWGTSSSESKYNFVKYLDSESKYVFGEVGVETVAWDIIYGTYGDGNMIAVAPGQWYVYNSSTEKIGLYNYKLYNNPNIRIDNSVYTGTIYIPRYMKQIGLGACAYIMDSGSFYGYIDFLSRTDSQLSNVYANRLWETNVVSTGSHFFLIPKAGIFAANISGTQKQAQCYTFVNGQKYSQDFIDQQMVFPDFNNNRDAMSLDVANNQLGDTATTSSDHRNGNYVSCSNGDRFVGFASADTSKGSDITVGAFGSSVTGLSGFEANAPVYIDINTHSITQNKSKSTIQIGFATATDSIYATPPC